MPSNALQVQQLGVRYGTHVALEDISFEVATGAFLALIGPNGAGKSTLLKAALGLVPAAHITGSVRVLGRRAGSAPEQVAYVPQLKTFDRAFPALAWELVATGASGRWPWRPRLRQKACEALARVGAETLATRRIGALSGGELQRIYLARALLREPKLLLFDEPATGIDTLGEQDLYTLIESLQRQNPALTVLMITHDHDVARHHASLVALLNRRLIQLGTPEQALCPECIALAYGHAGHDHTAGIHEHAPAQAASTPAGGPP